MNRTEQCVGESSAAKQREITNPVSSIRDASRRGSLHARSKTEREGSFSPRFCVNETQYVSFASQNSAISGDDEWFAEGEPEE